MRPKHAGEEIRRSVAGTHGDPFSFLGMHEDAADGVLARGGDDLFALGDNQPGMRAEVPENLAILRNLARMILERARPDLSIGRQRQCSGSSHAFTRPIIV